MHPEVAFNYLIRQLESDDTDDITLTIYYGGLSHLVHLPTSIERLTEEIYESRIVITNNELKEHLDLLRNLNADVLVPVEHQSRTHARIHYAFTQNNRVIFDVTMWGFINNNIFINGHEFKWNNIFIDIVLPFLPEEFSRIRTSD